MLTFHGKVVDDFDGDLGSRIGQGQTRECGAQQANWPGDADAGGKRGESMLPIGGSRGDNAGESEARCDEPSTGQPHGERERSGEPEGDDPRQESVV